MDAETKLRATQKKLYKILASLLAVLAIVAYITIFSPFSSKDNKAPFDTVSDESPKTQKGKELFAANCAVCHNKNMKDKMTGPALGGVEERWNAYPKEDLYNFIKHSQTLIKEGHPRAVALWKEYQPTIMNDFGTLRDEDIKDLLAYINR